MADLVTKILCMNKMELKCKMFDIIDTINDDKRILIDYISKYMVNYQDKLIQSKNNKIMNILDRTEIILLPNDLFSKIFKYLPFKEMSTLHVISKQINLILKQTKPSNVNIDDIKSIFLKQNMNTNTQCQLMSKLSKINKINIENELDFLFDPNRNVIPNPSVLKFQMFTMDFIRKYTKYLRARIISNKYPYIFSKLKSLWFETSIYYDNFGDVMAPNLEYFAANMSSDSDIIATDIVLKNANKLKALYLPSKIVNNIVRINRNNTLVFNELKHFSVLSQSELRLTNMKAINLKSIRLFGINCNYIMDILRELNCSKIQFIHILYNVDTGRSLIDELLSNEDLNDYVIYPLYILVHNRDMSLYFDETRIHKMNKEIYIKIYDLKHKCLYNNKYFNVNSVCKELNIMDCFQFNLRSNSVHHII